MLFTRALLFNFLEKLFKKRKYLKTSINNIIFLKTNQLIFQKLPTKANSNFSSYWYYFINNQVNCQSS